MLTRDRLVASNLDPSAVCRFCGDVNENLHHLVHTCTAWDASRQKLDDHELGENFQLLGLIEHPHAIAEYRLKYSNPHLLTIQPIVSDDLLELWSDGSVFWPHLFWFASAGFALVDRHMPEKWSSFCMAPYKLFSRSTLNGLINFSGRFFSCFTGRSFVWETTCRCHGFLLTCLRLYLAN